MLDDFRNAFSRHNNAHIQLIIINVVVFVFLGTLFVISKSSGTPILFNSVYKHFTLPSDLNLFATKPWTLITYSFAHYFGYENGGIGIFHIFFNMLGFYWFSRVFVEYLGSDKLIALYVLGAISGGLLYILLYNVVPYFSENAALLVGSSASVFAIVASTATLLPNYSFYLLFLGPVKIKYIAAFFIVTSFFGTVGFNAGGNIAHLGGALIGFVYIKQLQVGVNWGLWVTMFLYWIKNLFKSKPKVKVSYRSEEQSFRKSVSDKISQEEIDDILDKISEGGYESLTREEKEKLFNASKK